MTDGGVARNPLRQLGPIRNPAPFEQLFRPLVRKVEAGFHVDDGLAINAEAEMTRFDNPRMHRADRNLVDPFPLYRKERKRAAVV